LVGPKGQDLVVAVAPTSLRGCGVLCSSASGSEASQVSKVFGSVAFGFSIAPGIGVTWQGAEPLTYVTPLEGTQPYEIDGRFSLTFEGITQTEFKNFLTLPDVLTEPFFLYDDSSALWIWQLEHVLLTGYTAQIVEVDTYNLELDFARLRH